MVSPWLAMLSGLLIGLFVSPLVHIKMQSGEQTSEASIEKSLPAMDAATETDERVVQAGKPPRFRFYTWLPTMEVVVHEQEVRDRQEQGIHQ